MGRPRQRSIGVEYFLPADGPTAEKKIARSVIAQAGIDATSRDEDIRLDALRFFLGESQPCRIVREHWFMTAQLQIPDIETLRDGLANAVKDPTVSRCKAITEAWVAWRREKERSEEK